MQKTVVKLFVALLTLLLLVPSLACVAPKTESPQPGAVPSGSVSQWSTTDTLNTAAMSEADVSPDGTRVVFSLSNAVMSDTQSELDSHIYLADVSSGTTVQLTAGDAHFSSPQWSPDGKSIAFLSNISGMNEIWLMPAQGGEAFQLTHGAMMVFMYRWSSDGSFLSYLTTDPPSEAEIKAAAEKNDPIVVGANEKMIRLRAISTHKNASGEYADREITGADYSIYSWDFSPDGATVAFVRQHQVMPEYEYPATISTLDLKSGVITDRVLPQERTGYNHIKYSPDGQWIAYETIHSFYFSIDVTLIPAAGGAARVLAKDQDESLLLGPMGLLGWSADSKNVYISNARGTRAAVTVLPLDGSQPRDILNMGFIAGARINNNSSRIGLIMEDYTHPQEVYFAELKGTGDLQPQMVSRLNTNLPVTQPWKSETVQWKSANGKTIQGTLTYPAAGAAGQKFPLVVEAHGGPAASFFEYYAGGRSWYISPAGAFASRGYAMLRPNVRGSSGYGADFVRANYRDWGGGDFKDILAGVDYLVKRGIADPERLAIMGQSYGGYMTAWAVTQTTQFKAAVMVDGMSDLISDTGTVDILQYMHDYYGKYFWEDYDIYMQQSPIAHVEKVKTPTLVLHGQLDPRVPVGQGWEFYNALKLRGIDTRMVMYPRSGHFPGEPKLIRDMWDRELAWFDQYCGTNSQMPVSKVTAPLNSDSPSLIYRAYACINNRTVSEDQFGVSEVVLLPYDREIPNFVKCNGALLKIRDYPELFSLVQKTYGGDGTTTFAVPNLKTTGLPDGLYYYICVKGLYPSEDTAGKTLKIGSLQYYPDAVEPGTRFTGEIIQASESYNTRWIDSSEVVYSKYGTPVVLLAAQYSSLYRLMGNTFGSDPARQTFNLPNVFQSTPVVPDAQYSIVLYGANIPQLPPTPVPTTPAPQPFTPDQIMSVAETMVKYMVTSMLQTQTPARQNIYVKLGDQFPIIFSPGETGWAYYCGPEDLLQRVNEDPSGVYNFKAVKAGKGIIGAYHTTYPRQYVYYNIEVTGP